MSSIVKRTIKGQIYLYESTSYRNENGQPRNKQNCIGKIDSQTGEPIYNETYRLRMLKKGVILQQKFSVEDVKHSTIKEFGAFYLYQCIAEEIGLLRILKQNLTDCWDMVFNLACYLISNGEPVMYCEDWIAKTEALPCTSMSPPRISELLNAISPEQRSNFFEQWGIFRSEQEYLALDITSVSSYSELIADVEWGYNRDKEKLPQINLCLLLGEKSGLPVFQTVYSGSLKDVSTLKTTLSLANSIAFSKMTIVMDKGFCSTKNINAMLSDTAGIQFLIAMSFTLAFTQNQIDSEIKDIDQLENAIVIGDDVLLAITKVRAWNKTHKLFTHIYYNDTAASIARNRLYAHVVRLKDQAYLDPEAALSDSECKKYLIIRKSDKQELGYTINVREDVVKQALKHCGWLVITSNHISDAKEAISIYRAKDVVEKGFMRIKNSLDLNRLRVHSDNSMQNKVFIGFIALIIMSRIHKVMLMNDLYKTMTMQKLINILASLKVQYLKGSRILYPITKTQKDILVAFGFHEPV